MFCVAVKYLMNNLFNKNVFVNGFYFQFIKQFYNETYTARKGEFDENYLTLLWSLTTAMFLPGGMIGAYTAGFIADKLGRYIITACKRSYTKVMFLQVSVCPQGLGVGTSHASWDRSHGRVPLPHT